VSDPFLLAAIRKLSIDEARVQAFNASQHMAKDIDPRYRPDVSLQAALELTVEKRMADDKLSESVAKHHRYMLGKYARPLLARDKKTIIVDEIESLKHKIARKKNRYGKPMKVAGNQVVALLSLIFRMHRIPMPSVGYYKNKPPKPPSARKAPW
jgi:hypothetical protein